GDGCQNDMVDMESAIAGLEETLGRVAGLTGLNEDLLAFAEDSMSEVSTAGDGATLSGSPDSSSSMPSGVAKSDSALSASSLSELGAEGDLESAYRRGASSQASAGASLLAGEGT